MANTQHFVQAIDQVVVAQTMVWAAIVDDIANIRLAILEMGTKLDAETLSASDFNADAATTLATQLTAK